MPERSKRLTAEYRAILPPEEALAVDARRVVAHALGTGEYERLNLNGDDSSEFQDVIKKRIEKLGGVDPRKHILFESLPPEALLSLLSDETLEWDIESDEPLDPMAAQAILDLYDRFEQLPPAIHQLTFPLFMVGYHIGHSTRVAIYNALMAQKINQDGLGYKIDPVQAAVVGFLHDLGKLEPEQKKLVRKPGEFSRSEYEKVKNHPRLGADAILSLVNHMNGRHFPAYRNFSTDMYATAHSHHVRPDHDPERSYPRYILPSDLSSLDQLTSLTDAFDSMTTRKYGYDQNPKVKRGNIETCFADIERCKGTQFDPDLAELFCRFRPRPKIL